MSYTHSGRVGTSRYLVEPGTPLVHTDFSSTGPVMLVVTPTSGATATVRATGSAAASIDANEAQWSLLRAIGNDGTITGSEDGEPAALLVPDNPFTGIRVEVSGGTAIVEVTQP